MRFQQYCLLRLQQSHKRTRRSTCAWPSAALHYDKQAKTWAAQAFVPNDKFVLRRLNDDERKTWRSKAEWGFFGLEETWPTALCGTEFDLTCLWGAVEFEPGLSWRLYKDNPNNPGGVIIETGKCSAL